LFKVTDKKAIHNGSTFNDASPSLIGVRVSV